MPIPIHVIPISFGSPAYDDSVRLRDEVLRQPLKLEFQAKDLAEEYNQVHLAGYTLDYQLCGILVLKILGKSTVKMRQVAVAPGFQGQQVGRQLVEACEKYCHKMGWAVIELNARDVAVPFYERLDYQKVGTAFTEVGIKHYKMEKKLNG